LHLFVVPRMPLTVIRSASTKPGSDQIRPDRIMDQIPEQITDQIAEKKNKVLKEKKIQQKHNGAHGPLNVLLPSNYITFIEEFHEVRMTAMEEVNREVGIISSVSYYFSLYISSHLLLFLYGWVTVSQYQI